MRRGIPAMMVLIAALLLTRGMATATAVPVEGGSGPVPLSRALTGSPGRTGSKPLRPMASDAAPALTVPPVPEVQVMLNQVVSATLCQYVGDLSGEWPVTVGGEPYALTTRYTDSGEPILKATQFVGEHLAALGLAVEYHYWDQKRPPNVVGEVRGERWPEEIAILSAHLDSLSKQPMIRAPGADDNASGAAAVLLAADILSQYDWDCTLRFALWTGEEQGLLGSKAYAQRASDNGERIAGVLNLDMIGWDAIEGPDVDLHARQSLRGSIALAQLFAGVVEAYSLDLIPDIIAEGIASSDHASFWRYGYPAILGIEDYDPLRHDFNRYNHTEQDRLDRLNIDYLTEFAKASIGTFAHMGCLPNGAPDWQVLLPLVMWSE